VSFRKLPFRLDDKTRHEITAKVNVRRRRCGRRREEHAKLVSKAGMETLVEVRGIEKSYIELSSLMHSEFRRKFLTKNRCNRKRSQFDKRKVKKGILKH